MSKSHAALGVAVVLGALATLLITSITSSADKRAAVPSIEGTYMLVSRDLPDGSKMMPPSIAGMLTYTKEYRNFNVSWKDTSGKNFSLSYIARYKLSDKDYGEQNIYRMVHDEIGGQGITYDRSEASGSTPVTIKNGQLEMKLPLWNEPNIVFDGDKMTASRQGEFVDHWEKVD